MRLVRYITLLLLMLFIGVSFGQNPPSQASFTGGMGDGWSSSTFLPSESYFFTGGSGDGWSNSHTDVLFNQLFSGGKGDGWSYGTFQEVMTHLFNGGQGDGWDNNSYNQSFTDIFAGGKGDGWASAFSPMTALPLSLLSFQALNQESEILLQWVTTAEHNASHFIVERSDGDNNFVPIDKVIALGNSSTTNHYSIIDTEPMPGNNLYRLKMLDLDGSFTFSNVVLVRMGDTGVKIIAFPNPVRDFVNIKLFKAFDSPISIHIYDPANRLILSGVIPARNTQYQFNLRNLAKGTYIIRLIFPDGDQRSIKIMK